MLSLYHRACMDCGKLYSIILDMWFVSMCMTKNNGVQAASFFSYILELCRPNFLSDDIL